MDNVYCQFGGSIKILSDNGTEFKNKLIEEVSEELGVEYKIYSPPYRPQSNGRIAPQLEWDDIVPLALQPIIFYLINIPGRAHFS